MTPGSFGGHSGVNTELLRYASLRSSFLGVEKSDYSEVGFKDLGTVDVDTKVSIIVKCDSSLPWLVSFEFAILSLVAKLSLAKKHTVTAKR